jgi:hypothetical protein
MRGGNGMKYAGVVLCGLIFISGCGRMTKIPQGEKMVRQVFTVELSKDAIYDRALEWCAKKYVSLNDAIVIKDREKGKIIGKGMGKYSEYFNFLVDRRFGYNFTIEVKEHKYRVTFDNFIVYYNERDIRAGAAEYEFETNKIRNELVPLLENLRDFISRGVSEEKKIEEEW